MNSPIRLLDSGISYTDEIYRALRQHPELWNQHKRRTEHPQSPHREVDDIWVRYSTALPVDPKVPYYPEWYPACDVLPIRWYARALMDAVDGEHLGSILITRVPAGKQVYPHVDSDWHAGFYDKYALQLKGDPKGAFCYDGVEFHSRVGDLYWFRNDLPHWVTNESEEDRITLIICIKPGKGY